MIGWPRRIPRVEAQRPRWLFTADVETTGRRGVFIQAAHLSAAQIVHDGPQIGFLGAARSTRQRCCSPSTTLTTTSGSPRKLITPPHPIGGSVNRQRVSGNPDRIAGPGRGADAPGSTGHRHVAAAADTRPPRSPRRPTTGPRVAQELLHTQVQGVLLPMRPAQPHRRGIPLPAATGHPARTDPARRLGTQYWRRPQPRLGSSSRGQAPVGQCTVPRSTVLRLAGSPEVVSAGICRASWWRIMLHRGVPLRDRRCPCLSMRSDPGSVGQPGQASPFEPVTCNTFIDPTDRPGGPGGRAGRGAGQLRRPHRRPYRP